MAYGFGRPTDWDTILVFDVGGGTYDLSLLEAFEGIMEVSENIQFGVCHVFFTDRFQTQPKDSKLYLSSTTPSLTQVILTGGEASLGGDDFTAAISEALVPSLPSEIGSLWNQGR